MWPLLAIAGFSGISNYMQGAAQNKQTKADNAAKAKANLSTMRETAQVLNSLAVQSHELLSQAATARATATRQALIGKSTAESQAAAAGVHGASVDAVQQDIERELNWYKSDLSHNVDIEAFNAETQVRSVVANAKARILTPNATTSNSSLFVNSLFTGALSAGSTYASAYFKMA